MKGRARMGQRPENPLLTLDEADREFVLQLVLASGSLKDLARHYAVSYPTIRARLDRLIARIRERLEGREPDPMAELLAGMVERGELSPGAGRAIRDLHRRERAKQEDEQ